MKIRLLTIILSIVLCGCILAPSLPGCVPKVPVYTCLRCGGKTPCPEDFTCTQSRCVPDDDTSACDRFFSEDSAPEPASEAPQESGSQDASPD